MRAALNQAQPSSLHPAAELTLESIKATLKPPPVQAAMQNKPADQMQPASEQLNEEEEDGEDEEYGEAFDGDTIPAVRDLENLRNQPITTHPSASHALKKAQKPPSAPCAPPPVACALNAHAALTSRQLCRAVQLPQKKRWEFQLQAKEFYVRNVEVAKVHRESELDPRKRESVLDSAEAMWEVSKAPEEDLTVALKYTFEQYNAWEGGINLSRMDRMRFHKVMRDARLLCTHDLPSGELDKIYGRVKPEAQPTLNFVQFMEALRNAAMHKRISLNEARLGWGRAAAQQSRPNASTPVDTAHSSLLLLRRLWSASLRWEGRSSCPTADHFEKRELSCNPP